MQNTFEEQDELLGTRTCSLCTGSWENISNVPGSASDALVEEDGKSNGKEGEDPAAPEPWRPTITSITADQNLTLVPFPSSSCLEGSVEDSFSILSRTPGSNSSTRLTAFSLVSSVNFVELGDGPSRPKAQNFRLHWSLESVIRPETPLTRRRKKLLMTGLSPLTGRPSSPLSEVYHQSCLEEAYTSLGSGSNVFSQFHPIFEESPNFPLAADDHMPSMRPHHQVPDDDADDQEGVVQPDTSPLLWVVSKTLRIPAALASNMVVFFLNRSGNVGTPTN